MLLTSMVLAAAAAVRATPDAETVAAAPPRSGSRLERAWIDDELGVSKGGKRSASKPPTPPPCTGGMCSSLVHYPVRGTSHYAEFNVPKLPEEVGPTFFVYYNIDWQPAGPKGSFARMNQFVPQLMLGNPLDGSSGPPMYKPQWNRRNTWVFGAQYFFEIFNETANATQSHAATGTTYNCSEGETIFTSFTLSQDWVWTLKMGVKGDPSRLSVVVAPKPFMGLLPESQTKSWSEDVYNRSWCNTCWELYGVKGGPNYPRSDQRTTITITNKDTPIKWGKWSSRQATCPGHPVASTSTTDTPTQQTVIWDVNFTSTAAPGL